MEGTLLSENTLRVLLVGVEQTDTIALRSELNRSGFAPNFASATTHADFLEGLDTAPDLVLCEYEGRDFGALRALELLQDRGSRVPLVVLAGPIGEEAAVDLIKRGAADFVRKDRLSRLGSVVTQAISQQRRREPDESKSLFTRFMRQLPGLSWVKDLQGRYVYANDGLLHRFGMPADKLHGLTDLDLVPTATAIQFRENDQRALTSGGLQTVETLEQADGAIEFSLVCKFPIPDAQGQPALVGGVAFNITAEKQAEDQLRASEERFRSMADASPVFIWVTGANNRFTWINQSLLDFLGLSLDSVREAGLEESLHPDDRVPVRDARHLAFDARARFRVEYRLRRHDGVYRWLSETGVPTFNASGAITGYVGCADDITERRQAEEELRQANELLRAVTDNTTDAIFVKDRQGRYLMCNPAAAACCRRSVDEVLGRTDFELFDPLSARVVIEHDRSVMASGKPDTAEEPLLFDGSAHIFLATKAPFLDAAGNIIGVVGIARDITERKSAEEELRRVKTILTQASHLAHLGAWQIDLVTPEDIVTAPLWWSDEVYRLFGYEPGCVSPNNTLFFEHVHPEDRDHIAAAVQRSLATNEPYSIEHRIIRADGAVRVMAERAEISQDAASGRRRIVGAVQDVTDRKRTDAVVAAQSQVLERIASGAPLADVLKEICLRVEEQVPQSLCSILLLDRDGGKLWVGAAPNLPREYNAAIDGVAIGPMVGSCGAAAFRRETVAVSDIEKDPLWQDFRDLAIALGLRACWSTPIFSLQERRGGRSDEVLGTFAVYHRAPDPDLTHLEEAVTRAAHLAGIAIERERALRAISESEQRYRDLVEMAPDCVAIVQHGRFVYVNREGARLIGAESADQLLGQLISDFLHPDDLSKSATRQREVLETGRNVPLSKFRLRRLDGAWIVLESCAGPCRHNGEPAVQLIARDVSEQTRAEEALLLRDRAIQAISEGILITDPNLPDNPIIYVNRGFERVTGYTWAESVNRNCRILQGPGTDPTDIAKMRDAVQSRAPCHLELRNYRKDGSPFWNALRFDPIFDLDGRVTHFVGVISDVSERRLLEEQFQQSQKMEAFGQLAGGVAHDFNNLLTVINGFSEMLLSEMPAFDSRRSLAEDILKAGERAAALTAQLLAFSRRTIVKPRLLDLNQIVENLGKMLRRLIGEDIVFVTHLDPVLSKVKLDPGLIEQALMNLAVNARDAMPRGGRLTIETSDVLLPDDTISLLNCPPGRYVKLSVADTGHGMTDEVKQRAFEPFFTTKEPGKGTGLGLATVYGIAKQGGGQVRVHSEVGRGTTFELLFPVVSASFEPTARSALLPVRGRETILLVEDEAAVRRFTRVALEGQGYHVLEADCGATAIQSSDAYPNTIHLLATDMVMPGMGGRELAESLRSRRPGLRVLFMSGYTDDDLVRRGVTESNDTFLQKPFTPLSLAHKVRAVLDGIS